MNQLAADFSYRQKQNKASGSQHVDNNTFTRQDKHHSSCSPQTHTLKDKFGTVSCNLSVSLMFYKERAFLLWGFALIQHLACHCDANQIFPQTWKRPLLITAARLCLTDSLSSHGSSTSVIFGPCSSVYWSRAALPLTVQRRWRLETVKLIRCSHSSWHE